MDSRTRKHFSRLLVVLLALAALASLAGAGALVLERRGLVVLRRVPRPIIKSWAEPGDVTDPFGQTPTIAIVNTDTTPGAFFLEFRDPRSENPGPPRGFNEDISAR